MEMALMGVMMAGTAVGTGVQAYGQVMAGREASRAASFEQEQLKIQEQQTRTAASQAETKRRDELTSSLQTIEALRAGRGVGATSPTGLAIFDSVVAEQERDIVAERSQYLTKADLSRRAADMAGRKAKMSLLAGNLAAIGTVATGVTRMGSIAGGQVSAPRY